MKTSATGITTLCLLNGDTDTYPSDRPSIRTLVRRIENEVYLVKVHLPKQKPRVIANHKDWSFTVEIKEVLLVVMLTPQQSSETKNQLQQQLANWYGASLGGTLCNTYKMYVK